MLIEAIEQRIRYRLRTGEEVTLRPGVPMELPDASALQLLAKAGDKVRLVAAPQATPSDDSPAPPLHPGWLVAYVSRAPVQHNGKQVYQIAGGCSDRDHGTVQLCTWNGVTWVVCLTDGQRLPLRAILGVGRTNAAGEVVAAWTVQAHGVDGKGRGNREGN